MKLLLIYGERNPRMKVGLRYLKQNNPLKDIKIRDHKPSNEEKFLSPKKRTKEHHCDKKPCQSINKNTPKNIDINLIFY
jgi:hypothetical protein